MADDPARPAPEVIATGFAALVEGLRDDMREDSRDLRHELAKVEERVTARVAVVEEQGRETRAYIERFAKGHAEEHEAEAEDRRTTHGLFFDFIRAAELDKARRDGALGVVRYSIELLSRHAPQIVAILTAIGLLGGFATGNISIGVGQPHP